jgi:hypothetical protein
MLKSLNLQGVGPVRDLSATFGERLNVITGDNGLGKSFLLDVCFWVLTGSWPGRRMAIPDSGSTSSTIVYDVKSKTKSASGKGSYNFKSQTWSRQRGRPPMAGLVLYAAIDGSFAVWDPARNYWRDARFRHPDAFDPQWSRAFQFPPESLVDYEEVGTGTIRRDVANGLEEAGQVLCNGLIADWSEWFYQRSSQSVANAFGYLEEVISVLSHPSEPIRCEEPQKVFLTDSRKFPTLRMPYGLVPHPHWSAGVKRIINFSYLLVWAWVSHLDAAKLRKEQPTDRIILLVDEVEAHLHPKWQRTILPAILRVVQKLQPDIAIQILAATHSPLVLASVEPHFDEEKDQLFSFSIDPSQPASKMVSFDPLPWAVHGDVVGWLTSDIFGLEQARSREAERAIEAAEAYMRGDTASLPDSLTTKEAITAELRRVLAGLDPFWPRWIVEAK